jgi:hypothetical protein
MLRAVVQKKPRSQRRRPRSKARKKSGPSRILPFRDILVANSYSALRDESYSLIQRCVDETLKDPELREKIEYHARKILQAIASKL